MAYATKHDAIMMLKHPVSLPGCLNRTPVSLPNAAAHTQYPYHARNTQPRMRTHADH